MSMHCLCYLRQGFHTARVVGGQALWLPEAGRVDAERFHDDEADTTACAGLVIRDVGVCRQMIDPEVRGVRGNEDAVAQFHPSDHRWPQPRM